MHNIVWNDNLQGWIISFDGGEIVVVENFVTKKISDRCLEYFQENDKLDWKITNWSEVSPELLKQLQFRYINWKQDYITMFGKRHPLPRLTSWYGDPGREYTYSGIKSTPNAWNEGLLYLKKRVEELSGERFNSLLMNWYRCDEDDLGWHADDEPELGKNPVIGSATFGETRDFVLRKNSDHSQKITVPIKHGMLLIMRGELQHNWQHAVPKRKRVKGSRFNLTFRYVS